MTWPGPEKLGRGVVVSGDGPPPPPWAAATEVVLDEASVTDPGRLNALVDGLHRRWVARSPVVVRWSVPDDALEVEEVETAPPWRLDPRFLFPLERLRFLCFSNNYDARHGEPRWWWTTKARRIDLVPGGPGDGLLPDGTAVWIDGGPRGPLPDLELPVIHGESIDLALASAQPEAVGLQVGDLAPDQRAAVVHPSGPARIIAPAGSGKTRTLTRRVRHLLDDHRLDPRQLVAVAYNERAAAELRDRLHVDRSVARTIHSLGWQILREAKPGLELLDERDLRRQLERLITVPRRSNTDPYAPYLEALSEVRSRLRDPEEVEARRDDVVGFSTAFEALRERMYATGRVDHDEQVYGAIEVLLTEPGLRAAWQRRCRHLLVDEFQDLTPAFVVLLRLLASPQLDVFGVGDDDQVIYGYDGADPGFLIDFDVYFPGAEEYALEVNYRCPPAVVDAAVCLLEYNNRRIDKTIRSARSDVDATALTVDRLPGETLAGRAAERIVGWLHEDVAPRDIAVLTRVNSSLIPVKAALVDLGIPTNDRLSSASLDRTAVQAVFAWMRIGSRPERIERRDSLAAVRRPSRGLNRLAREVLPSRTCSIDELYGVLDRIDGKQAVRWQQFCDDVTAVAAEATSGSAPLLLHAIIDRVGLASSARSLDSGRRNAARSGHQDDLVAVQRAAALHPDLADFVRWLRTVLDEPSDEAGVMLSSVHRVKGMEWSRVIVLGADRGSLPHDLAEDREEERRIFHVALTRSIDAAVVLADERRPSPFLDELDGSAPRQQPLISTAQATPGERRESPAAVGDRVRVWGGHGGEVVAVVGGEFVVRVDGGADITIRPGEIVEVIPADSPPLGEPDADLFEALRAWRLDTSRRLGVPAYVVLHNRSIEEIARRRPTTEGELLAVSGLGPAKLENYGDDILAVVASANTL
jgi:DNA helicase-2/ATP-dependent DNA helicase PcrA